MFKKEYKDYMNQIKPKVSLVEAMVEEEKKSIYARPGRSLRVAAAVFFGVLLVGGGTVAVDAATNGGIQRLLGLKDSVGVGEKRAEFVLIDPTEEHPYGSILESKIAEDGTLITEIKSTDDVPVFTFNFAGGEGYGDFVFACSFIDCETKEEFAEKVYQYLTLSLKAYKPNKAIVKEVIEKLEMIKQEVGTGTAMRDGCAMGVQLAIDDLRAGKGVVTYEGKKHEVVEEIVIADIKEVDGASVFSCYFNMNDGNASFEIGCSLKYCKTKEEIAWKVYVEMMRAFEQCRTNNPLRKAVIEKLELVKQEIGTGTNLKDGAAMGVQFMIDDLIANTGRLKVMEHIITDSDDVDGDGDLNEVLGLSFFNFDFEAMKQETEETGKREFVVEAIAGIPGKYRVKVEYYEPGLLYYLERME